MKYDTFVDFLKEYVTKWSLDLKKEPPQASFYGTEILEGKEALILSYPHLILDETPPDTWGTLIRIHMKEKERSCEGFVFWCVVEKEKDSKKNSHLLFLIYRKEDDEILTYKSDIFLTRTEKVPLGDTLPFLIDDYGVEIEIH